jgi:hypothetical protein
MGACPHRSRINETIPTQSLIRVHGEGGLGDHRRRQTLAQLAERFDIQSGYPVEGAIVRARGTAYSPWPVGPQGARVKGLAGPDRADCDGAALCPVRSVDRRYERKAIIDASHELP